MPPELNPSAAGTARPQETGKATGMDTLALWIGIISGTLVVCAVILRPRSPKARPQADIRREWSQARPNWQGHEGWGGRE
jgi:hypothetical protein